MPEELEPVDAPDVPTEAIEAKPYNPKVDGPQDMPRTDVDYGYELAVRYRTAVDELEAATKEFVSANQAYDAYLRSVGLLRPTLGSDIQETQLGSAVTDRPQLSGTAKREDV